MLELEIRKLAQFILLNKSSYDIYFSLVTSRFKKRKSSNCLYMNN